MIANFSRFYNLLCILSTRIIRALIGLPFLYVVINLFKFVHIFLVLNIVNIEYLPLENALMHHLHQRKLDKDVLFAILVEGSTDNNLVQSSLESVTALYERHFWLKVLKIVLDSDSSEM